MEYYFNWAQYLKFTLESDSDEIGEHQALLNSIVSADNHIYENFLLYR